MGVADFVDDDADVADAVDCPRTAATKVAATPNDRSNIAKVCVYVAGLSRDRINSSYEQRVAAGFDA